MGNSLHISIVTVVNKLTSLQHTAINCKCFRGNFHKDLFKAANQLMTNSVESIVISFRRILI